MEETIVTETTQPPHLTPQTSNNENKDDDKDSYSSSSSCRPPQGKTYLTIGQDLFSINEYMTSMYNASLHDGNIAPMSSFSPAAAMVYTDLASFNGMSSPTDYGSGVEFADGILDSIFTGQNVGLQIGLWLDGEEGCRKITDGKMQDEINRLVKYLENCKATKVFLRIGYEFDNPDFNYSGNPMLYASAFRVIVDSCRDKLSSNALSRVLFVWHSWALPRRDGVELEDFYPGDNYVDWIGVSIFTQLYPWDYKKSFVEDVLQFAIDHDKPTMIAESTPFGGIHMDSSIYPAAESCNIADPWERWFGQVLELINKYDISMWSFINCNWRSQRMWHSTGFGDTRISVDEHVMSQWRNIVLGGGSGREFLMEGSLLNCGESVTSSSINSSSDDSSDMHWLGLKIQEAPLLKQSISIGDASYRSKTMLSSSASSRIGEENDDCLTNVLRSLRSGSILMGTLILVCVTGLVFFFVRVVRGSRRGTDATNSSSSNFAGINERTPLKDAAAVKHDDLANT